jgi:hypothetical protein
VITTITVATIGLARIRGMDRIARPPSAKSCARRPALVLAPAFSSDSDISVARFSACHIVVGPERLTRLRFPATPGAGAGSWDVKPDMIVTSSGALNVLVAARPSSFSMESGLKS